MGFLQPGALDTFHIGLAGYTDGGGAMLTPGTLDYLWRTAELVSGASNSTCGTLAPSNSPGRFFIQYEQCDPSVLWVDSQEWATKTE